MRNTKPRPQPYTCTASANAEARMSAQLSAGMTLSAADALRGDQQTFNRAQVACLIALAFQSGRQLGIEEGHRERDTALADGLRIALGGPDARNMGDAVSRHLRQADQKQRRQEADRYARKPRPHGLQLVAKDWPPVTEPGTVTAEQARAISAHLWPCPCERRKEPHWLDGYHRTPEPFPTRQANMREAA